MQLMFRTSVLVVDKEVCSYEEMVDGSRVGSTAVQGWVNRGPVCQQRKSRLNHGRENRTIQLLFE